MKEKETELIIDEYVQKIEDSANRNSYYFQDDDEFSYRNKRDNTLNIEFKDILGSAKKDLSDADFEVLVNKASSKLDSKDFDATNISSDKLKKCMKELDIELPISDVRSSGVMQKSEKTMAEYVQQFMDIMDDCNMKGQSKEYLELLHHTSVIEKQLVDISDELRTVKAQLNDLNRNSFDERVTTKLNSTVKNIIQVQEKIDVLFEKMVLIKEKLEDLAKNAVEAFEEKGKSAMTKVIQSGISGINYFLSDYRSSLNRIMEGYQKVADQIDNIGNEMKQIGNSTLNVGRLLIGKDAKTVSNERDGILFTRIINKPIKIGISNFQKVINSVEQLENRMTNFSNKMEPENKDKEQNTEPKTVSKEKEAESNRKPSVRDKIVKMQVQSEQRYKTMQKEKVKEKSQMKAECL